MRRIVVFGCGFAGYQAARKLERSLEGRRRVELTIVNDRSHFLFTPLLPNVATGELDVSHITFPLHTAFDSTTRLVIDRIEAIDFDQRVLRGRDQTVPFDYLLIAPGAQTDWKGPEDWKQHAVSLKTSRDAVRIYHRIARALETASECKSDERRREHLTFVFGGAGSTGVELVAEIVSALQHHVLPDASPALREAMRIIVVDPADEVLHELPEPVRLAARKRLDAYDLELRMGISVTGCSERTVELSDGSLIDSRHLFWCGGVRTPPVVQDADLETDSMGRIKVDTTLRVADQPGVFAAGDVAGLDPDIPQTAQVADQQGPVAAKNIIAELSGRAPVSFDYFHRGHLITLGRRDAVAGLRGVVLEGKAAWALYRVAYTALMPSGLKKARLLSDWIVANLVAGRRSPGAEAWRQAIDSTAPASLPD